MFVSLPHCAFDISATGKRFSHGGKYGPEIPVNLHFYSPEQAVKLAENKIMKIEENFNETVKHCVKSTINVACYWECPI